MLEVFLLWSQNFCCEKNQDYITRVTAQNPPKNKKSTVPHPGDVEPTCSVGPGSPLTSYDCLSSPSKASSMLRGPWFDSLPPGLIQQPISSLQQVLLTQAVLCSSAGEPEWGREVSGVCAPSQMLSIIRIQTLKRHCREFGLLLLVPIAKYISLGHPLQAWYSGCVCGVMRLIQPCKAKWCDFWTNMSFQML